MQYRGPIAWMAYNPIAANLLMLLVMVAGLYSIASIKKEVFPTFPAETFSITVPYPGSSPSEVEKGILIKIEEAIMDIPGIEEIRSTASEGQGVVTVEIYPGENMNAILSKAKTRVDGISSFPAEAEDPIIEEILSRTRVLNLSVYGPLAEKPLRELADEVREDILQLPGITQISLQDPRHFELSIEIPEDMLKKYQLGFEDVVQRIRQQSNDIPGGNIRTSNQTITIRSSGQARDTEAFKNLVLSSHPDGTVLRIGDVATVTDGFEEQPVLSEFNNQPAFTLQVDRIGDQSALDISKRINEYVEQKSASLPEGIKLTVWADLTYILEGRIQLLLKSASQGALLVILALALFLRPVVAFWVVAGVPFCFLGALAVLGTPMIDHSINVISLFGFILVLGIIVDDAIVTAESAYYTLEKENQGVDSIIKGVKNVTTATVFGIITTILAFMPVLFQTEGLSRLFTTTAAVVILCLFFSIIETKFILPAHLRHINLDKDKHKTGWSAKFSVFQQRFSRGLIAFSENRYRPFLERCLRFRYVTASIFIALLVITLQLVPSGIVKFIFFPNIPSDYIVIDLEMPQSTSYQKTHDYALRIKEAGLKLNERYRQETGQNKDVIDNLSVISTNDTAAEIRAALIPSTERDITSVEMAKWWREYLGELPGTKSINVDANAGRASIPVNIRFISNDLDTLRKVAQDAKLALLAYDGVYDVRDTFDSGAPEIEILVSEQGKTLGLGQAELARQVRQAFFGAEVQRFQRERDEIRVYTRLPENEREALDKLRDMWIRLPSGEHVPFSVVGIIEQQEGISTINRIDRQRVVNVQANVDKARVEPGKILASMEKNAIQDIIKQYPGVSYYLAGEAEEQEQNQASLILFTSLVLILIYAALAIPLKSYLLPVIIMSVIPFGIQGAIIGHLIFGKEISIISIVGMVALGGIVVNDSLVLIDYINQKVRKGSQWREAVAIAGERRFRAVILTSLTTFVGLLPIQLETSIQAQFLKPMAISVAFGVLFATFVTLIFVPVLCYIIDDIKQASLKK